MRSSIKISQNISIQSELRPLTQNEKNILKKIKKKKSRFFFSTFLGFLLLIPAGWVYSLNGGSGFRNYRPSDDMKQRIQTMAPYFYLFVFLLIAIYFISYYRRLLVPVIRDLNEGVKEILYYDPKKYQTPFFADYYIVTPVSKKSRIKIDKELYDRIQPGSRAAISYSIHSHFIFSIEIDEKEIFFNETHELIDK